MFDTTPPRQLDVALKEWDAVCRALLGGRQSLILRKGGIAERQGRFLPEHDRFLLFPTFVHQQPEELQPPFRDWVQPRDAEPARLRLPGWAEVLGVSVVKGEGQLDALAGLTIYQRSLLQMRWDYKPDRPLFVMAVRVHRLNDPPTIDVSRRYAGCRSWVVLDEPAELGAGSPVLSDTEAEERLADLADALQG